MRPPESRRLHEISLNGRQSLAILLALVFALSVPLVRSRASNAPGGTLSAASRLAESTTRWLSAVRPWNLAVATRRPESPRADDSAAPILEAAGPSIGVESFTPTAARHLDVGVISDGQPAAATVPTGSPGAVSEPSSGRSEDLAIPPTTPAATASTGANSAAPAPEAVSWTIQVKATPLKADAEMLAGRIGAKGYAVAVVTTVSGGRTIYRVRVGRFTRRDEADDVRARLANEEQMETWVVRTSTGSTPARR